MGIEPLLLKSLQALKYANGAYLIAVCAAAGILLASRAGKSPARLPIDVISPAAFYLFCGVALAYAFYPNFSDHAEPAMTSLGIVMLKGKPLYPGLDEYSFHGLLYGPLLAEIQAAAIFLGTAIAGLPVLLASKLAGVLAFFLASGVFFKLAPGWGFARAYYTLFLLPFGILAFWNRCEPVFLLLVAFCFWAIDAFSRWRALLILGICAGLASGLKLHGFLYIAPAVAVFFAREKITLNAVLLLLLSAAGSFLLVFLPGSASLPAFFDYLLIAAGHGLSWQSLLVNLIYVCALWSPLVVVFATNGRRPARLRPPLLALGALQVVTAIIASKPGAGIHHLLPFIPANALAFAGCIGSGGRPATQPAANPVSSGVWIAMLLPGLAACVMLTWNMTRDWQTYDRARQELERIQANYPDVVMGIAGNDSYPYVFLRPMLGAKGASQIEYSSFMDLQLVGVSDAPLRQAFETCRIRHLAMPKKEPPFSLMTYYSSTTPLFSDGLREAFRRHFVKVANGTSYDTYECTRA